MTPITMTFDDNTADYYSLADAGKALNRARSTIMRLLKAWEAVTGSKPQKAHNHKWYVTVASVDLLMGDPKLYLELAGRATKWEDENKALTLKVKCLEADCAELKKIIKHNVPKSIIRRLQTTVYLLKDMELDTNGTV